MGKSTISMAIFNSYVKLPEGISFYHNNPYSCSKLDQPSASAALRHSAGHPFWGHALHRPGESLALQHHLNMDVTH